MKKRKIRGIVSYLVKLKEKEDLSMEPDREGLLAVIDHAINSKMRRVLKKGEKKGWIFMDDLINALPNGDIALRFDILGSLLTATEKLGIRIIDPDEKEEKNFQAQKWVQELTEEKLDELGNQIFDLLDGKKEN